MNGRKFYPHKRDANEKGIVAALRAVGATVQLLDAGGVPDLLVGYKGATFLLEVKLPLGVEGGKKDKELTERQVEWWALWTGAVPILVRSADDALKAIGAVDG